MRSEVVWLALMLLLLPTLGQAEPRAAYFCTENLDTKQSYLLKGIELNGDELPALFPSQASDDTWADFVVLIWDNKHLTTVELAGPSDPPISDTIGIDRQGRGWLLNEAGAQGCQTPNSAPLDAPEPSAPLVAPDLSTGQPQDRYEKVCAEYSDTRKHYWVDARILSGTILNEETKTFNYDFWATYVVIF